MPLRIAAWLVLAAKKEGLDWQRVHPRELIGRHPLIPAPMMNHIENGIWDLQQEYRELSPELRKLAQQLDPNYPLGD